MLIAVLVMARTFPESNEEPLFDTLVESRVRSKPKRSVSTTNLPSYPAGMCVEAEHNVAGID